MSSSRKSSNKPTKVEKEQKLTQSRIQTMLMDMLRHDDNKYCVDCDAKGPRWSSWNIGVFMCIRCAGIHRKMGVHISRVKSVNLDEWTLAQVSSVQQMGNSRGRAVYEANLPDVFQRPVSDISALENFIRAKYEKKKYIAREFVPSSPKQFPDGWNELIQAEKEKKDIRKILVPFAELNKDNAVAEECNSNNSCARSIQNISSENNNSSDQSKVDTLPVIGTVNGDKINDVHKVSDDLLGLDLGSSASSNVSSNSCQSYSTANNCSPARGQDDHKSTRDSILALYDQEPSTTGVPTCYPVVRNSFEVSQINPFVADLPAVNAGHGATNATAQRPNSTALFNMNTTSKVASAEKNVGDLVSFW